MDRKKAVLVVKGYLLKEKKNTILTCLFLCFITVFLLIGNELFQNLELANQINAESLEGKQHVTYYGIEENEFQKIKKCPFVAEAGMSVSLGQAQDGTSFAFIDPVFRDLSATVADKNVKQMVSGYWAKKKNEVVFTENYMKKYHLKLGDSVYVHLTATDSDTGDRLFQMRDLKLTVVGMIENVTGFTDRKMGYVSEEFAYSVIREYHSMVNVVVRFVEQKDISGDIDRLNQYLDYDKETLDTVVLKKNAMLMEAVSDNGQLKKQNKVMNLIIWLVCVMVVYNIFYNRFFSKKKDFTILRKIGFKTGDLLKITGMEFFILFFIGFMTGIFLGFIMNKVIYSEIMKLVISDYNAGSLVSSSLSLRSIKNTGFMFLFILVPSIITAVLQLRTVAPVNIMSNKRTNKRKLVLSLMIVSLSAVLISLLGIQDNESDAGIIYVKTYVPGDLQITIGTITQGMLENTVPVISDRVLQELRKNINIKQFQSYEINYDAGAFLCEKKSALNKEASGYYEMLSQMQEVIDGHKQCLYNITIAAADNIKAMVSSYSGDSDEHIAIMEEGVARALNLEIGDTFTLYSEEIVGTGSKKGVTNVKVKLIDTKKDMVLSESHVGPNLLIVDKGTAKIFPGELSRQVINIWTEDKKETEVISDLNRIPELSGCLLHSAKQQMQEYIDSDRNQNTVYYFFIILLILISVLTYFNTVLTNILDRIYEFMIMYKVGITKMEWYQMVIKEGVGNGMTALCLVGLVQMMICINRQIVFGRVFFLIDIGVFVLCVLFPVLVLFAVIHRKMTLSL